MQEEEEVAALRAQVDVLQHQLLAMQLNAVAAREAGAADAAAQAAYDVALAEELAVADEQRGVSEEEDGDGEVPEEELSGSEAEEAAAPPEAETGADGALAGGEGDAAEAAGDAAALPPAEADEPARPQRPEPLRASAGKRPPRAWKGRGDFALHAGTAVTVLAMASSAFYAQSLWPRRRSRHHCVQRILAGGAAQHVFTVIQSVWRGCGRVARSFGRAASAVP